MLKVTMKPHTDKQHMIYYDSDTPTHTHLPKEIRNLVAGGLAGILAKTIVAPIDRIKILYQVTSLPFLIRDVPHVITRIVKSEGMTALWKGNTATMIRVFPYAGIQFMVFNQCKLYFINRHNEEDNKKNGMKPMESLRAGSLAGAVSVLCTYPLDLTRAQLAVLKKKQGSNGVDKTGGFLHVLSRNYVKGGFTGLFRGIAPTLLGILPYAGISFAINEQAKHQIYKISGNDPTTIQKFQCGALSGLIAQSITYPLEVTRRRMQTFGLVPTSGFFKTIEKHSTYNPSMLRTINEVIKEQGLRGLYKGLSINWLKGPLTIGISFTTFDLIQGWLALHYH